MQANLNVPDIQRSGRGGCAMRTHRGYLAGARWKPSVAPEDDSSSPCHELRVRFPLGGYMKDFESETDREDRMARTLESLIKRVNAGEKPGPLREHLHMAVMMSPLSGAE